MSKFLKILLAIVLFLFIPIIVGLVMTSIPGDDKQYLTDNKLKATDDIGREQLQPLSDDWAQMNVSLFSFSSASEINISGITPSTYFQVGDRLRIKQDDTTKYFNIYKINDTSINVDAGDEYTFTNDAIQTIAFSRILNPIDFPHIFDYSPSTPEVFRVSDNSWVSASFLLADFSYRMEGRVVTVLVDTTLTADDDFFRARFDLPIAIYDNTDLPRESKVVDIFSVPAVIAASNWDFMGEFGYFDRNMFTIRRIDSATMDSGNTDEGDLQADFRFEYEL